MTKCFRGSLGILVMAALLFAVKGRAATADARVIPYDGYLEEGGVAGQGPYVVHAQLYADPGDVNPLWSEYYTVQVEAGRFFILIGGEEGGPLPEEVYAAPDLHLSLDVNGEQLLGMQRILALPFATSAARAGHLLAEEVTVASASSSWLHLAHDGTDGRAPQEWTVGLGEVTSLFLIEDSTNGGGRPFAIQPGAPDTALYVSSNGDVGLGTGTPGYALDLSGSDGDTALMIAENSATAADRQLLLLRNRGRVEQLFNDTEVAQSWMISASSNFRISSVGTGATELRIDANGDLRITGSYFSDDTQLSVPDHVFTAEHALMPLDQLERYVQRERHLPRIPSAAEVERDGLNITELQLRLLEKVEELTLYTIEQHRQLKALRQERDALERRLVEIERSLSVSQATDDG